MYEKFGQKYLYFSKYQTKDRDNVFNKINNKFAIQSKGKKYFFNVYHRIFKSIL